MAVASFGLATNRVWVTKQGERKEDAQFHRIVAWNKLAELCSQLLSKGRRVYVDGRIQYRDFTDAENNKKQIAEIVIDDMIILDNKGSGDHMAAETDLSAEADMGAGAPVETEGSIEDIVIPDDIGEPEAASAKQNEEPKEEAKEDSVKQNKDEEMPF